MDTHNEMEAVFNTHEEVFSIININVKFSLNSIMNMHTCLNANLIVLRVPVGLVRHWYSVPSVMIQVSESISTNSNDSLGENMRFLVQMVMVSIRVVKGPVCYQWEKLSLLLIP